MQPLQEQTDTKFKSFYREMIICFLEANPHYVFPACNPLSLLRW